MPLVKPKLDPLALNSGDLRHTIQIQAQSTTQDGFGGQLEVWSPILTTTAAIRTASARELYQAAQFSSQISHIITIRWPGAIGIQGGQQVVFGSRKFKLQTVDNVQEQGRVLLLQCLEINGAQ